MTDDDAAEPPPRPPSAYLATFMRQRGISAEQFAQDIGFSKRHVDQLLADSRVISHEVAWAIGKAYPKLNPLGLLNVQAKWRLHVLDTAGAFVDTTVHRGPRRKPSVDEDLVRNLYRDPAVPVSRIREQTGASMSRLYKIIDAARIPRRARG